MQLFRTISEGVPDVSVVGFGCGPRAGLMLSPDSARHQRVLGHALDRGINYFDTAQMYGDGTSELNLGKALRLLAATSAVISTKIVVADLPRGEDVRKKIGASLSRLRRERIDVLTVHNRLSTDPGPKPRVGETPGSIPLASLCHPGGVLDVLREEQQSGRVGIIGLTGFGSSASAVDMIVGDELCDVLTVEHNLLSPWDGLEPTSPARPWSPRIDGRPTAVGIKPLANGRLVSATLDPEAVPGDAHALRTIDRFHAAATKVGCPPPVAAWYFATHYGQVASVHGGFRNQADIDQAIDGLLGSFDAEAVIDAVLDGSPAHG